MGSSKLTKTMQNEYSSPPFDPSWWISVFWSKTICVWVNSNIFNFLNYSINHCFWPTVKCSLMFIDVNVSTCWNIVKLAQHVMQKNRHLSALILQLGLPVRVQRLPLRSLCMVFAFTLRDLLQYMDSQRKTIYRRKKVIYIWGGITVSKWWERFPFWWSISLQLV